MKIGHVLLVILLFVIATCTMGPFGFFLMVWIAYMSLIDAADRGKGG